nr:SH3 domain-containing protein 2 [Ipomoea batatas]
MSKLESAETKLHELKSNMGKLGKEASAAMADVEAQQQRLTLQSAKRRIRGIPSSLEPPRAASTPCGKVSAPPQIYVDDPMAPHVSLGASANLRLPRPRSHIVRRKQRGREKEQLREDEDSGEL